MKFQNRVKWLFGVVVLFQSGMIRAGSESVTKGAGMVATVSQITGDVTIVSGQAGPKKLTLKDEVPEFSVISTASHASVSLLLRDSSEVKIGADSKMQLNYQAKDADHVDLLLRSGTLKSLVKKRVDQNRWFRVKTPTVTMGVRGTEFVTRVTLAEAGNSHEEVQVTHGSVQVADPAGKELAMVKIGMGLGFDVAQDAKQGPRILDQKLAPKALNPAQVQAIHAEHFLISPKELPQISAKPDRGPESSLNLRGPGQGRGVGGPNDGDRRNGDHPDGGPSPGGERRDHDRGGNGHGGHGDGNGGGNGGGDANRDGGGGGHGGGQGGGDANDGSSGGGYGNRPGHSSGNGAIAGAVAGSGGADGNSEGHRGMGPSANSVGARPSLSSPSMGMGPNAGAMGASSAMGQSAGSANRDRPNVLGISGVPAGVVPSASRPDRKDRHHEDEHRGH